MVCPRAQFWVLYFFLIYTNDISIIKEVTEISLVADDTAIVGSGKTPMFINEFSKDIQSINDWCNVNKLSVNTDKSKPRAFEKTYRIPKFQLLAKILKI